MFGLPTDLGHAADQPLRLLCLGAHADDIEIGAGGTVLRLLRERPQVEVTWAVVSASGERADEARTAAAALLADAASVRVEVQAFRDGFFPHDAANLKAFFRETLEPLRPHLVLTHRSDDAHQDHRTVGELSWQTFRGARIAAYEVPKWDADLDRPNAYVALDAAVLERKLAVLAEHFPSQQTKGWYDEETFRGLARVRGVEASVRYAEAFHCRKLVW